MKLTKIQWVTLVAILVYLIYEFIMIPRWEATLPESDPVIRADIFLIYPVLLILILISVFQFFRKK
ncbi:MAG: hypothetical protein WBN13_02975 [Robiginitalea sp.]|jgi:hypothetical protein|uniref:hypothetical protein n=1 Tax=Robiginitalea sp. TaxID=1902411 RepID=UPI003C7240B5